MSSHSIEYSSWRKFLLEQNKSFILITDNHLYKLYEDDLKIYPTIVIQAGEKYKNMDTAQQITEGFIKHEVDRSWHVIAFGGGVITDIAGFVASIYMRGLSFSFIPTSLLAMVDASIGGKNGIDFGPYKNFIGTFTNPEKIVIDTSILSTLPQEEWVNGSAEIIKHACIQDANLFEVLEKKSLSDLQNDVELLNTIVKQSANIKVNIVEQDPKEKGLRKLLNFGHTFGHAIETTHNLPHGKAITLGMIIASFLSVQKNQLPTSHELRIKNILRDYHLIPQVQLHRKEVFEVLKMDKKRRLKNIDFVVLDEIGKGKILTLPIQELEDFFTKVPL